MEVVFGRKLNFDRNFHEYNFHGYNYEAEVSQFLSSANSQDKAKGFDENTKYMYVLTIRIGYKPTRIFILHCSPWTFQSHGSRACHLCLCRTPQKRPAGKDCVLIPEILTILITSIWSSVRTRLARRKSLKRRRNKKDRNIMFCRSLKKEKGYYFITSFCDITILVLIVDPVKLLIFNKRNIKTFWSVQY